MNKVYDEMTEALIEAAIADGRISDKERRVLLNRAKDQGIDPDELDMIIESRLYKMQGGAAKPQPHVVPPPMPPQPAQPLPPIQPKAQTRFGSVRKCPGCGATLQAFHTICPECGLEFRDADTTWSSTELFKIMSAPKSPARDDQIRSFPVPNAREDLLEILTIASSNACDPRGNPDTVWLQKCDQIYQKIIICSATDKQLLITATRQIATVIAKLPRTWRNFTNVPKEMMPMVNEQTEIADKAARKAAFIDYFRRNGIPCIIFYISLIMIIVSFIATDESSSDIWPAMGGLGIFTIIPSGLVWLAKKKK